ncbi:hypothetical protein MWH28_09890 [Natroniella sulfidigena]|uniref:hypothetical protein n=1 Tax=Natroniella sulfidigena TaxID=723921 RepID=UPI00200B73BE|nr:hypothetical protein [Natroniella sulfidigena]MCK8817669.1 hypothetical protein [Natroniella sulfidigena]
MRLELIKLVVGTLIVIGVVLFFYFSSGTKQSLDDYILSKLINFWGKVVNLIIMIVSIWFGIRVGGQFLRRVLYELWW